MRKLTFICALVIVFAISTVAFAEVQSIRVSGEINTYGIWRANDDFGFYTAGKDQSDQFIMSTIGLNFDADLTENVAAHLRLVSQRDWDRQSQGATSFDVGIAQAYITLSEMLYEPLTIKIGSMPLYYGRGLLIGYNLENADVEGSIAADEYGLYGTFDAITATLDYAPWTIDFAAIKTDENQIDEQDDHDLYLVNVGYDFENEYAAEAEGYLLYDDDSNDTLTSDINNEIYTLGIRGSMAPVENSLIFGELAYQFGDYNRSGTEVDVDALGIEVGGEYSWVDALTSPKLALQYTYLSGDKAGASGTDDYENFTATFCRKSDTAIYGWNGRLYTSTEGNDTAANTNMHKILLTGNLKPLASIDNEDVNLEVKYAHFIFDEEPVAGKDDEAGDELNLNLTYNYTEDVQFGLLGAIFWPGEYYEDQNTSSTTYDDTVKEIVGSCKVTF